MPLKRYLIPKGNGLYQDKKMTGKISLSLSLPLPMSRFNAHHMKFQGDVPPEDRERMMTEYLQKYWVAIAGRYVETDEDGTPIMGYRPMQQALFYSYLKKFQCGWEDLVHHIKVYERTTCGESAPHAYDLAAGAIKYDPTNNTPLTDEELKKINKVTEHMHDIMCDGNRILFQHLIDMFALKLLYPYDFYRIEQALVLFGKEGCGKTSFIKKFFTKCFGERMVLQTDFARLKSKFNAYMKDKLIYQIDDGGCKMNDAMMEHIKRLITEDTVIIEQKFVNTQEPSPNRALMIISANEYDRIKISRESRRFFCLYVGSKHIGDLQYFLSLFMQINNHLDLVVRWILSQYSGVDKLPVPPISEVTIKAIEVHRTNLELFFREELMTCPECYYQKDNRIFFGVKFVLTKYRMWTDDTLVKQQHIPIFLTNHCTQMLTGAAINKGKWYFKSEEAWNDFRKFLGLELDVVDVD